MILKSFGQCPLVLLLKEVCWKSRAVGREKSRMRESGLFFRYVEGENSNPFITEVGLKFDVGLKVLRAT